MMRQECGLPAVRFLSSTTRTKTLIWAFAPGGSFRSYELHEATKPLFCVSTRSSELVHVLQGEETLSIGPAGQTMLLREGQTALIGRNTPHIATSSRDARLMVVDLARPVTDEPALARVTLPSEHINALQAVHGMKHQELRELSHNMVSSLHFEKTMDFEHNHSTRLVKRVQARINQRFHWPVSIADLAKELGMDRFYMARSFKRAYGASPLEYLQFLRMEHVTWSLLERPEAPLTELASSSGYGDYATFSKRLRKLFGKPPSQLLAA